MNYMKQVAEMLGVEMDTEFEVEDDFNVKEAIETRLRIYEELTGKKWSDT